MALTGLHVTCSYAGSSTSRSASAPLRGRAVWSETLALPATTTNVAAPISDAEGESIFAVRSTVDAFVSIGKSPNATTGTRSFVPANTDYDFYAQPGDRLAAIAA